MKKITKKQMKIYRNFILNNLEYLPLFTQVSIKNLRDNSNGYGAKKMPKNICKLLNKIYKFAPEAAIEHDITWALVEAKLILPTSEQFYSSNRRLKNNIIKCANLRYNLFNFYRYWCITKAYLAQLMCNLYGQKYWNKNTTLNKGS